MKKLERLIALLLVTLLLTSCGLLDRLGFDTYDYMSESITVTHEPSDETAVMLEELLMILVTDSPMLPTFENMSEAISYYRDAVLEYLLSSDYAKYSGNSTLIEMASRKYPEYQITQVIPELEFESAMYRYFGGDVMITHRDGGKFRYLPDVEAYIPMLSFLESDYHVDVTSLSETEKTYRVRFRVISDTCENGEATDTSEEYFALVIKREDGSLYIKKLLLGSDVR